MHNAQCAVLFDLDDALPGCWVKEVTSVGLKFSFHHLVTCHWWATTIQEVTSLTTPAIRK